MRLRWECLVRPRLSRCTSSAHFPLAPRCSEFSRQGTRGRQCLATATGTAPSRDSGDAWEIRLCGKHGSEAPGSLSLRSLHTAAFSVAARDAPATRGLRFATPEPSAEGTTATAAARKGDVSAVEKRLSELEEKAEKTFPALAASLAARSRRAEQSDERLGRKAFVFVDPSGERVPLVRHCSLDQRHAKREEAKGDVEVGVEDVGRFRLFDRQRLLELFPEGFAGDLHRDVLLLPPSAARVGLMIRRLALELQVQLQRFAEEQSRRWDCPDPSTPKAFGQSFDALDADGRQSKEQSRQRGFLLDGHRGVGKGWLVVFEPLPSMYAKGIGDIRRSVAGVYIQCEFARTFLERLSLFNGHLLERMSVDMATYGNAALDGVHRRLAARAFESLLDATVAEELDEYRRQICSQEGVLSDEEEFEEAVLIQRERLRLWRAYSKEIAIPSLRTRLPAPKSLLDIANFGVENEAHATQACYEIMEQLKKQITFNLLVVVVSEYLSMRYENTKFGGRIPAYHLAIPRLLSFFDGGAYRRGMKVVATSWSDMRRRDFRPELLGVRSGEIRTVRNFSPIEFASYVDYLQTKRAIHGFDPDQLNYYYMMTGGNGFEARRLFATLH